MRRRLKFIVPLAILIVLGGVYKVVLAKTPTAKPKVDGQVYVLPKEFLLNLADGHFAKLAVALVLAPTKAMGRCRRRRSFATSSRTSSPTPRAGS